MNILCILEIHFSPQSKLGVLVWCVINTYISRDGHHMIVYDHKLFLFAFLNKGEGFDDFDPGLYTKICFEITWNIT